MDGNLEVQAHTQANVIDFQNGNVSGDFTIGNLQTYGFSVFNDTYSNITYSEESSVSNIAQIGNLIVDYQSAFKYDILANIINFNDGNVYRDFRVFRNTYLDYNTQANVLNYNNGNVYGNLYSGNLIVNKCIQSNTEILGNVINYIRGNVTNTLNVSNLNVSNISNFTLDVNANIINYQNGNIIGNLRIDKNMEGNVINYQNGNVYGNLYVGNLTIGKLLKSN
jgi:hypothetical protein